MRFWYYKGVWASKYAKKAIKDITRDDIKSIAVIRHAALGDMVLTRAFLLEARKAFPHAAITLSVVSNYTLGVPHDLIDRLHIIHGHDQRDTPLRERIRSIRELGYHDLIFDLASSNRSYMLLFFNKAMLKIGFPYRKTQAWIFNDVATCRSDLNFEVDDMLNMLKVFGARTAYPHVYNMPGNPVTRPRPYIIYFTSASVAYKCWPADRFIALLKDLSAEYPDYDHIILEGVLPWEKEIVQKILTPFDNIDNVYSLSTSTVEEATDLIQGSRLVVSNDTGIRHLGIVSQIPTVGIFLWEPYRYWPRCDIHDVAIPDDSGPPEVSQVKQTIVKQLENVRFDTQTPGTTT
jgi:ADP-heptose:LPS heptosyltransferase